MKKTITQLADGRELIYYDEDESTERSDLDTRELPHVTLSSEIRYDAVSDDWVIVASHRQDRTFMPPASECPLCPSRPGHRTEVPAGNYDIVVFENRFPSLAINAPEVPATTEPGEPLFRRRAGRGRCEVVCFSSDHDLSFADLSPGRVRSVLEVWIDRTLALSSIPGVELVFPFENRGEEIGVTLTHPHGQIYAYPFTPQRVRLMLESARSYRRERGGNLFADLLAAERRVERRIVATTGRWTAFVPAAARWPVEVHLYPNRRVPTLPELDEAERGEFAEIYLDVLRRLDRLFDRPLPYIAAWQQAPIGTDADNAYLHLELMSIRRTPTKLKYLAGSESGMGAWINDVRPEQRAEQIRAAHA